MPRPPRRPPEPPPEDHTLPNGADPGGESDPGAVGEEYERILPSRFDSRNMPGADGLDPAFDDHGLPPDGTNLWDSPRPHLSRRVESLAKPMVDGDYGDAETWRVEKMNKTNGLGESVGDIHIDCTEAEFIMHFLPSMPQQGEEATTFRLIPITRAGTRWGNEPVIKRIPWEHVTLQNMRAADLRNSTGLPGLVSPGGMETAVLTMMKEQLKAMADRTALLEEKNEIERAKAEKERDALVSQRIALAAQTSEDMSGNFKKIGEATHTMYASVNEMQTRAADAAIQRQAMLAAEERERVKTEREREKEDRAAELAVKLAAIRADADARKAELALEQIRIIEAAKERRQEEVDRRKEDDARRADERLERAKLDAAMETARAERAAAEDKRRDEHAKLMEAMRQEARTDAGKRMEVMRADEKDYAARRDALIQQQLAAVTASHATASNPLAGILDMVSPLGFTPTVIGEMLTKIIGGGGGGSVLQTTIEQIGGIVKSAIESQAPPDDDETYDGEGDDDPSDNPEPTDAEIQAERRAQQAAARAAATARQEARRALPGPTAGNLDASTIMPHANPTADAVPVADGGGTALGLASATTPESAPTMDMTIQREGRKGFAALWAKLQDTAAESWQGAIHEATAYGSTAGVSNLLAYLIGSGLNTASAELEIPAEAVEKMAPLMASIGILRGPKVNV